MKNITTYVFLFLTLSLLSQGVYAQKIGKKQIDTDLIEVEALISQEKYVEAKEIIDRTITSCRSLSLFTELSQANYLKGNISNNSGLYEEAFTFYWTSYTLSKLNEDLPSQFDPLFAMGELFYRQGYYSKAIEYFDKCDKIIYVITTSKYRLALNDRLSDCYYKTHDYAKAIGYYFELRKYSIQYQKFEKEIKGTRGIANCFAKQSEYNSAIEYELILIPRFKSLGFEDDIDRTYLRIASDYKHINNLHKADEYYNLVLQSKSSTNETDLEALINSARINILAQSVNQDRVIRYLNRALEISQKINDISSELDVRNLYSLMYYSQSDNKNAKQYIQKAIEAMPNEACYDEKLMIYQLAIEIYKKDNDYDLVSKYQKNYIDILHKKLNIRERELLDEKADELEVDKMERIGQISSFDEQLMKLIKDRVVEQESAHENEIKLMQSERKRRALVKDNNERMFLSRLDSLSSENEKRKLEEELYIAQKNELKAKTVLQRDSIQTLQFERKIKEEQNLASRAKRARNYLAAFIVIGIAILVILLVFFFSIRKSNKKLKDKNVIIEREHHLTEEALVQLKQTQSQLLESERLASLGQLTAGIAHEIRNPLNFVNNFSELNLELAQELREEIQENISDSEVVEDVTELAEMIRINSEKISQHGERAARIIKQMLDSSRKGSTVFEETNIAQLLEDTAKLAYQGVRGRNVDFAADLRFDFDPNIGKVNVVSNDLGRVIINLVTNSCHAMIEKMELDHNYTPIINISSKDLDDSIQLIIEDNGIGINKDVLSKIFDPFYTTKPTGVGTGLGLTMSFDILTKVHKGEISVESEPNEFTRFKLIIPKSIS